MAIVNVIFEGQNCKLFIDEVEVTSNGEYEVADMYDWGWKLIADEGYDFSSETTAIEYEGGDSWTIPNSPSDWNSDFTVYEGYDFGNSLSVTNAIAIKKSTNNDEFILALFDNFENMTAYVNDIQLVVGKNTIPYDNRNIELELKYVADEGYYFDDGFHIDINGTRWTSNEFTWNEDRTVAIISDEWMFNLDGTDGVDGYTATIKPTSPDNFFYTENVVEVNFIYNEDALINGDSISVDGTLVKIIINANDGYEFDSAIEFTDNGGLQSILLEDEGWNEDKTQFIWNYTINGSLTINTAIAKLKEVPVDVLNNFTNIYSPTNSELTELSNSRYDMFNFEDGSFVRHDYGSYISALYIFPFEIVNLIDVRKQSVWLGGKEITSVKSSTVKTNKIVIDMGHIEVPEKYNNTYDYVNTDCYINLPFTTKVQLETSLVVGSIIGVEYVIDLYTGNATVNIRSDKTNTVIYSEVFKIGYNIPFFQQKADIVSREIGERVFNDVTEPFIEVIRNVPYGLEGSYGRPMNEYGMVGSYSGYVEVDKVDIGSNCTKQEKLEIQQLLKLGVFIGV